MIVPTFFNSTKIYSQNLEAPRVETRGYTDKTRLRGLGW